jgi:GNAT superfamily N-acetyltransferase
MATGMAIPTMPMRDLAETAAFYARLGFVEGFRQAAPSPYLIVRRDDMELHFFGHADIDPRENYCGCYLRVRDVAAFHAECQAAQIPLIAALENKEWGMREFAIGDPSGNLLRIGQPVEAGRKGPVVAIGYASREDLDGLLRLYEQLSPENAVVNRQQAVVVLDAMLTHPSVRLVVADVDGKLAGTATLVMTPNLTHGAQPWAQIENMVVDESLRRSGVGRTLLDHCLSLAWEAGCYKVQLQSANSRTGAHRFYEASGFEASSQGYRLYR